MRLSDEYKKLCSNIRSTLFSLEMHYITEEIAFLQIINAIHEYHESTKEQE